MPSQFLPINNVSLATNINSTVQCIHVFCTGASDSTNCSINDSDIRSPSLPSTLFAFDSTYGGAPSTTSGSTINFGAYRGLEKLTGGGGGGGEP